MDSWIFQGGYPVVGAELVGSGDGTVLRLTQERFGFDSDAAPGGREPDEAADLSHLGELWAVPVIVSYGSNGASRIDRVLLDAREQDFELAFAPEWVLVNAGGSGFYRVRYGAKLLHALAARSAQLTGLERYGLVDDAFASVLAGTSTAQEFVDFARAFADETDVSVWQRLAGSLAALRRLLDGEAAERYQATIRAFAGPALLRMGWEPGPEEDGRTRELRAALIELLGVTGGDTNVVERARRLHADYVADPSSVDPSVARAALAVVVDHGGSDDYEMVLEQFQAAATPQLERRYLFSLGRFHDDDLIDRTLAYALEHVRTQDAPFVLQVALANRTHGRQRVGVHRPSLGPDQPEVPEQHDRADARGHDRPQRPVHRQRGRGVLLRARRAPGREDARAAPGAAARERGAARPRDRALLRNPHPVRVRTFAVEDTTAQVWTRSGPGGPRACTVTGLEPGVRQPVSVFGERIDVTTLAPLPGAELCRIATVNDLHIGATSFGFLPRIDERPVAEPHPLRCARAALAEALAWGAQFIVVKGDLTEMGTRANWDAIGRLLAGLPVPVAVVPGNHDVRIDREVDPQPSLGRRGLHLVHGVEVTDLPGIRLLLVDSTEHDHNTGRVAHLQADVVRLLGRARQAGTPALVAMHHHPQRWRLPTFWPPGIPAPESQRFLDAVAAANPRTLVTTGHTHRHRRHRHGPVTWSEVGSTKDYPGTWTGYAVHEGGIRQVVRRVEEPSCLAWTDRTRWSFGAVWRFWSPGSIADRCFSVTW